MTSQIKNLLDEIISFTERAGMAESTFGRLAVNDGKFVSRLRSGKRCWPETEQKARSYMAVALQEAAAE